jgi:hypothetical protein
MCPSQDECYADCLSALKNGAVLLHPYDADPEKYYYLHFGYKFAGGYKENVTPGVFKRLIQHPRVKKEPRKVGSNWEVWKYQFEGDRFA